MSCIECCAHTRITMPTFVYIAVIAFLCAYALFWSKTRRSRKLLSGLPTYSQLPFIGSLHHISGSDGGRALYRLLNDISNRSKEDDKPFVFWVGPVPLIILNDLDDIKLISNTFIEKPYYYDFSKPWLGDGLVTAPGYAWKHNIKKLSGLFTTSVVDNFLPIFNSQAEMLLMTLRKSAEGPPVNIMEDLSYTTLGAIRKTALGVACTSDNDHLANYYKAFNRVLHLIISRGLNILLHPEFVYRLTPSYNEMQRCVDELHSVSNTVLKQRKQYREELKKNGPANMANENELKAVIDILLELGETDPLLTEKQIQSEVDTIILGGQETVATTTFFSILMLGRYPQIQEKLYNEIKSIFGDSKRPVEKADLNKMFYCEAIINETLRLFPPIPAVMRYADKDLTLKSCTIPEGATVLQNAWGLGRSARLWGPDALEYDPERWLRDQPPAPAAAFLAFSYGRRACIGKRYAMAIVKTLLTHCVRELQFEAQQQDIELKMDLALRAVSGHFVKMTFRKELQ